VDLVKLAHDWVHDPSLKYASADTVEDLAKQLVSAHKYLMDPEQGGIFCYLYQQQVRKVREWKTLMEGKSVDPTTK
jgi:hypothetical protein